VRTRHAKINRQKETTPVLADVTSNGYIGLWAILYLALMIFLGITALRKGHWVMFVIGIFIPLFWLIGALLPRRVL
jgi:hypothetical protein